MISPPTTVRTTAAGTTAHTAASGGRGAGAQPAFAQTLAGFLDGADDAAMPATVPGPVAGRQDGATDGNPLPDEDTPATADPAFAWMTLASPVIALRPVAFAPPATGAAPTTGTTPPVAPTAPGLAVLPNATPTDMAPVPLPAMAAMALVDAVPTPPSAVSTPVPTLTGPVRDSSGAMADIPGDTAAPPPALAPMPDPIIANAAPAPAGQVFAAAIKAAHDDDRSPSGQRDTAPTVAGPAGVAAPEIRTVAATGDAQQAPLDMRQSNWPQGMIDRIEHLRDAADAADTRIRLIPDALGAIDVGVRRDGDTMHVHFTAENAATATLLADAQPQLATLAQSRGLTLGQSAVDAGNGQSQAQPQSQSQRQPQAPRAPAQTADRTTASVRDADDIRLA